MLVTIYKFEFKDLIDGLNPFVEICRSLGCGNPEKVEAITIDSEYTLYETKRD